MYVDDILLASGDLGMLHKTKTLISMDFEMKDIGETT